MNPRPFKIILLSILLALSALSIFFIGVELLNIITTNFFVFMHPFNGLVRYTSRLVSFIYILLMLNLSIINVFKQKPVKTAMAKISLPACFIISFTFLAYLDFFVFLIFNISLSACIFLTFFIYWFIPNKKEIKNILTKNNQ